MAEDNHSDPDVTVKSKLSDPQEEDKVDNKPQEGMNVCLSYHIIRNAVIVLYVLLECLKWISTLLSLAIVAYP